ncbi:MAG: peptidoglycan DD-metalloendopeptidase family protein [Clostridia bacterium]|nr:peptidoglycan DD-metalloendopeptidase family protein [Clostridia bacterium]
MAVGIKTRPSRKTAVKARKKGLGYALYALCYVIGAHAIRRMRRCGVFVSEVGLFVWRKVLLDPVTRALEWLKFNLLDAPSRHKAEHRAWLEEQYNEAGLLLEEIGRISQNKDRTLTAGQAVESRVYQYRLIRKQISARKRRMVAGRLFAMACVVLCAGVFVLFASTEVALKVTYGGKVLGHIANEQVYDTAISDIEDRVVGVDSRYNFAVTPLYTMSYTVRGSVLDESEFSDVLLKTVMGDEVNYANGIYINDEFVVAVDNDGPVRAYLQSLLDPYLAEDPEADVSFLDDVEIRYGMYPVTRIRTANETVDLLSQVTLQTVQYTCVKSDTVKKIATKHNLSKDVLLEYNPDIADRISKGKTIEIVVPTPFLRVKTTVVETYTETIPYDTVIKKNSKQYEGWSKITKSGKNGKREIVANVFYVDGVEVGREIISSEVTKEPVDAIKQVGSKQAPKSAPATTYQGMTVTGKFMWPVDGGSISCRWHGYKGHEGLDIAASKGTKIYAADGGVVVTVHKWNYSYGYHVVIDHGNGFKTRYAHMSKIAASVGDKVEKGDVIGYVGNTGNSFGNHCHFEIIINGTRVNPEPYITAK